MDAQEIARFFDRLAPTWDAEMIRNEKAIETILDRAGVRPGISVLDVACGTGVLFPDYLKRNVRHVTGIDISPEMVRIAREKFGKDPRITLVRDDATTWQPDERFDLIMVYNAFPHFPEPERLLENLASLLSPGGRLAIAHGMSREKINAHHEGCASHVSIGLLPAEELAALFTPWFSVDAADSTDEYYIVAGTRL